MIRSEFHVIVYSLDSASAEDLERAGINGARLTERLGVVALREIERHFVDTKRQAEALKRTRQRRAKNDGEQISVEIRERPFIVIGPGEAKV